MTSSCVPRPQNTGGLRSASSASPGSSPGVGVAAEVHREREPLRVEPHGLDRDGGALREAEEPDRGVRRGRRPAIRAGADAASVTCAGSRLSSPSIGYQECPGAGHGGASGARTAATTNCRRQVRREAEQVALVGAVAVEQHEQRAAGALRRGRGPQHGVGVEGGSGDTPPSCPVTSDVRLLQLAAHLPAGVRRRVHVDVVRRAGSPRCRRAASVGDGRAAARPRRLVSFGTTRGMTTGPATLRAPMWTCAATAGAVSPVTLRV